MSPDSFIHNLYRFTQSLGRPKTYLKELMHYFHLSRCQLSAPPLSLLSCDWLHQLPSRLSKTNHKGKVGESGRKQSITHKHQN